MSAKIFHKVLLAHLRAFLCIVDFASHSTFKKIYDGMLLYASKCACIANFSFNVSFNIFDML